MYVHMYVRTHVHTCVCVYSYYVLACEHACMYVRMIRGSVCVRICAYAYVRTCVRAYVRTCVSVLTGVVPLPVFLPL